MSEKTLAENLIQIWCRKKYAYQHEDGDIYCIEVEGWTEGYCETCQSEASGLRIYKKKGKKPSKYDYDKQVDELTYVDFAETLNEMLFALKPLEE